MNSDEVITGQQLQGLQGLPEELLNAVLRQLDESSRLQVFRTSKLLATALLRRFPRIQLTYPTQRDIIGQHLRELPPFLTEVLHNRQQPKLHLTLQPAKGLTYAIQQRQRVKPAAAASYAARLVARMLGAVPRCWAVDCLTISWLEGLDLPWEPAFSAVLVSSFPSLTSLTFKDVSISIGHLAQAISHPLLVLQLLHLDLTSADITHEGQVGRSPFICSRLQTLSLDGWVDVDREPKLLSGLLPLPPTLTQLEVTNKYQEHWDWVELAAAVSRLTQLQELRLLGGDSDPNGSIVRLPALSRLPSLHTLVADDFVVDQEQLTVLLKLTQITRLQVQGFSGLTSSRASADCNWRRLEVKVLDWVTAAYLPLHSLTHPLRLHKLVMDVKDPSIEVLAAAELNLCERNQAGLVLDDDLCLSKATVDLLTEQYLSHSRRTAQHLLHPTVASSSSHSGGGDSSTGQGGQQGVSAAGAQPLMQRLGRDVEVLRITVQGLSDICLSPANLQALPILFPKADVRFSQQR